MKAGRSNNNGIIKGICGSDNKEGNSVPILLLLLLLSLFSVVGVFRVLGNEIGSNLIEM